MCSKYFNEVDKTSNKNVETIEEIKRVYESFKKIVFDPYKQNEARLFILETQFKESESDRKAEYYYLKEILNRVVDKIEGGGSLDLAQNSSFIPPEKSFFESVIRESNSFSPGPPQSSSKLTQLRKFKFGSTSP